MLAAIALVILLGLLAVFQIALAAGAPWGRFAWGGQHPGPLPRRLRIASGTSVILYAVISIVVLDRVGLVALLPDGFAQVGSWVIFGYFALGILMNAVSRSKPERYSMTPVALVLTVLALLVALSDSGRSTYSGMVLEDASGIRFCSVILESYPPQCGLESLAISAWDWSAVDHEQSQTIRWGEYRFTASREGDTLIVEDGSALER